MLVCLAPGPVFSLFFPNMMETLEPKESIGCHRCTCVRKLRKEYSQQGSPSRKNECGRGFASRPRAQASALFHCSAIWLTDVAQSLALVFLGNEQGQERAQGLLQ